jgi:hypothetical protein
LIVNRGSGTCEIINLVNLYIEREADVVTEQLEPRIREEFVHVVTRPGIEVIDAEDFVTVPQEALAQMRPNKSGAACHQNPSFIDHPAPFISFD